MKFVLAFAAALSLASPAAAQPQGMTVADFLLRAQALMMGGRPSPDSPELKLLRDELTAAGKAMRAQQQADRAANRPANLCIPEKAAADAGELIKHLQKIPADRRSGPFRDAFFDYAKAKYPC